MTEHPPVLRDPNKQVVFEVACAEEWHVNFADPRLYSSYGSGLFAQDEMQVAEHPPAPDRYLRLSEVID